MAENCSIALRHTACPRHQFKAVKEILFKLVKLCLIPLNIYFCRWRSIILRFLFHGIAKPIVTTFVGVSSANSFPPDFRRFFRPPIHARSQEQYIPAVVDNALKQLWRCLFAVTD